MRCKELHQHQVCSTQALACPSSGSVLLAKFHRRQVRYPGCRALAQVSLQSPTIKLAGRDGGGTQVQGGAAVRTFRVLYLDEVRLNPACMLSTVHSHPHCLC